MCILEKLMIGFGLAAGIGATVSGVLMALAIFGLAARSGSDRPPPAPMVP